MALSLGKFKLQQRVYLRKLQFPNFNWDIELIKEKDKVCHPNTCIQQKKNFFIDFCHNAAYNDHPSSKLLSDFKKVISRLLNQFKSNCNVCHGVNILTSSGTEVRQHNWMNSNGFKSNFSCNKVYRSGYNHLMIISVNRNYCNQVGNRGQQKEIKNDKPATQAGLSQENLAIIQERLKLLVMDMFKNRHDYGAFHKDVVMENNLYGEDKERIGVIAYAVELMKLRLRIHFRYPGAYCIVEDVKLLEGSNNVIRIQWKLQGVPQRHIVKFWRFKKPFVHSDIEYLNGVSYFHIGSDGLIHKHRLEKFSLPQDDEQSLKKKDNRVPFLG